MSDVKLIVGTRVELAGKDAIGTVSYIGTTQFSTGKWIGVTLDEAKGKNDGSVQGKRYFTCEDGHGIFVRVTQLKIIGATSIMSGSMLTSDISLKSESDASPHGSSSKLTKHTPQRTGSSSSLGSTGKGQASRRSLGSSTEKLRPDSPTLGRDQQPPHSTSRLRPPNSRPSPKQTPSTAASPASQGSPSKQKPSQPESLPQAPSDVSGDAAPASPMVVDTTTSSTMPISPAPFPLSPAAAAQVEANRRESRASIVPSSDTTADQVELTNLRDEVKRLSDALVNLKAKREEDRARLQEFEHVKVQMEQMEENRRLLREQAAEHQRTLAQLKTEKSELQVAFDRYKDEVSETMENAELTLLDKEMAEARLDDALAETDQLKEKIEELTLENQIMKDEAEVLGEPGPDGGHTPQQVKALEQQNERMKEALLNLRDNINLDKQEMSKLNKEVTRLSGEVGRLASEKQCLSDELKQSVEQTIELKDQVDASLGVDQMISQLTQRNLELEEKLERMSEDYKVMETLCEMNDELLENSREVERVLREEVQQLGSANTQLLRHLEASKSTSADHELTLVKFRDLVNSLQTDNANLKRLQLESARSRPSGDASQSIPHPSIEEGSDLMAGLVFDSQTKTTTKMLDAELHQLQAQLAVSHGDRLSLFLPDSFMRRGSDNDALLSLLAIERLLAKSDLLASHLTDRYPLPDWIPTHSKSPSTATAAAALAGGDQPPTSPVKSPAAKSPATSTTDKASKGQAEFYAFITRILSLLRAHSATLSRCRSVLLESSVELYTKMGSLRGEIEAQESSLDKLIELAKQGGLEQSVSLTDLQSSLGYFDQVYSVHLASVLSSSPSHRQRQLQDFALSVLADCDALATDATSIALLTGQPIDLLQQASIASAEAVGGPLTFASSLPSTETSHEQKTVKLPNDALIRLLADLVTAATLLRIKTRRLKRRLPTDSSTGGSQPMMSLGPEVAASLDKTRQLLAQLTGVVYSALRMAGQLAVRQTDESANLTTQAVLQDCLGKACKQAVAQTAAGASGAADQLIRDWLNQIQTPILALAESIDNGELDFDGSKQVKIQDPITLRADAFKQAQIDLENSRAKVVLKDEEVNELKGLLKSKATELSEMNVRVGMAERKAESAGKGNEGKISRLEAKIEQLETGQKRESRDHEQAIGALNKEIAALEQERSDLKEKLKTISKQTLFDSLRKQPHSPPDPTLLKTEKSLTGTSPPSPLSSRTSTNKDAEMLMQEIAALKEAVRYLSAEKSKLAGEKMRAQLKSLPPLKTTKLMRSKPVEGSEEVAEADWAPPPTKSISAFEKKLTNLQKSTYEVLAHPPVVSLKSDSKSTTTRTYINNMAHLLSLKHAFDQLQHDAVEALKHDSPKSFIHTDFAAFPTWAIRRRLAEVAAVPTDSESSGSLIGRLVLSPTAQGASTTSEPGKLTLDHSQLHQLHQRLMFTGA